MSFVMQFHSLPPPGNVSATRGVKHPADTNYERPLLAPRLVVNAVAAPRYPHRAAHPLLLPADDAVVLA